MNHERFDRIFGKGKAGEQWTPATDLERMELLLSGELETLPDVPLQEGISGDLSAMFELQKRLLNIGHHYADHGEWPKNQLQEAHDLALLIGGRDDDLAKGIKTFMLKHTSGGNEA